MSFVAIVTNAGRAALVNAQNNGTAPVTIASCGISAAALAPTVAATGLPGEIKRITTLSGDVVADDTIHLIVRDTGSDTYTVRSIALYLANGTLFAIYGQSADILNKVAASDMLLAIDIKFADIAASSLTFGDTDFLNPPATTSELGVVELATVAEAVTGTDDQRVVTPAGLTGAINARLGGSLGDVWRASNDGAGSGMDADLLDGQHGSYYANIPARLGYTPANRAGDTIQGNFAIAGVTYFNDDPQFYTLRSGGNPLINFDAGDYLVHDRTTNWLSIVIGGQGICGFRPDGYLQVHAGIAQGSNIFWHAGNDGAGSGQDADLLDGQHGSYYANIPARLGYTPANRAGDVIQGNFAIAGTTYFSNDFQFYALRSGLIPLVNFDAGDFFYFDRAANAFGLNIASQWVGGWSSDGFIDVPGGIRISGSPAWHAGNDGAGSGLDADTLDGKHASEFLTAADFSGGANANGRWCKRPDGNGGILIEQRGKGFTVMNEGTIPVSFPIPFTDIGSVNVQLTIIQQGSDSDMFIALENGSLTVEGFVLRYQSTGYDIAYGFHWAADGY